MALLHHNWSDKINTKKPSYANGGREILKKIMQQKPNTLQSVQLAERYAIQSFEKLSWSMMKDFSIVAVLLSVIASKVKVIGAYHW